MVILKWFSFPKLFAGRKKTVAEPTAQTSPFSFLSFHPSQLKNLQRRYRTYHLDMGKQKQLRELSKIGIVRRGINTIKDGVLDLPYEIVKIEKMADRKFELHKKVIGTILEQPNLVHDRRSFLGMILEDLIVLDAGIWNQCTSGNPMRPLFLYAVDATTMEKLQPYDFTNPDGDMYLQRTHWTSIDKTFSPKEIKWIQKNHFTHTPYGLSPIEVLHRYISYFMDALDNAADISSIDTVKFALALKGASQNELRAAQEHLEAIQGTGKIPLFGGEIDSKQIGAINSDSLFMDWQKFLLTLCAKCMNLPESCFITSDVNDRNNISEVRQQILTEAIRPYANLLESAINQHIVSALGITGIAFRFVYEETEAQKKQRTDRVNSLVTTDQITINEARRMQGVDTDLPTEYGNYTIAEAKARINEKHMASAGGFNGVGDSKAKNKTDDAKAGT